MGERCGIWSVGCGGGDFPLPLPLPAVIVFGVGEYLPCRHSLLLFFALHLI